MDSSSSSSSSRRLAIIVVLIVAVLSVSIFTFTTPQPGMKIPTSPAAAAVAVASPKLPAPVRERAASVEEEVKNNKRHEEPSSSTTSEPETSSKLVFSVNVTKQQGQQVTGDVEVDATEAPSTTATKSNKKHSSSSSDSSKTTSRRLVPPQQKQVPTDGSSARKYSSSYLPHKRPYAVITVEAISSFIAGVSPPLDAKSHPVYPLPEEEEARATFFDKHGGSNATAAAAEIVLVLNSLAHNCGAANGLEGLREMAKCSQRLSEDGMMWSYVQQKCVGAGYRPPLRSFEVADDELSCSAEEARKHWLTMPFRDLSNPELALQTLKLSPRFSFFFPPSGNNSDNVNRDKPVMLSLKDRSSITQQYSRFIFFTSWLFKQYRPWRPLPAAVISPPLPPPSAAAATKKWETASASAMLEFRSHHDDQFENLLRLENFCVSPLVGYLSGFGPGARSDPKRYRGVDDTGLRSRDALGPHNEPEFRRYFNNIATRKKPPSFMDERPVIFFPAMYMSSHNMAHSHFKFWSLLGLLKLEPFTPEKAAVDKFQLRQPRRQPPVDGPPTGQEEQDYEEQQKQQQKEYPHRVHPEMHLPPGKLKPLVVFVLSASPREKARARAFGFMYQMLDLPWAVVLSHPHDNNTVEAMMRRAGHGIPQRQQQQEQHGSEKSNNWLQSRVAAKLRPKVIQQCKVVAVKASPYQPTHSRRICENHTIQVVPPGVDPADPDEMCFRRGIVWQNCFEQKCINDIHGDNAESFNFYNYQPINSWRRWMMGRYEALLQRCLPVQSSSTSSGSSSTLLPSLASADSTPSSDSSPRFHRPRIFFDSRSSSRGLWNQNLLMDWVKRELVEGGFASDVIFRELWQGSRAQYLDDVRTSDIFAGVHGGSFAATMMLRPRPVVVEFAGSWSFCRAEMSRHVPVGPYCWFNAEVEHKNGSHWVVQTPMLMDDRYSHVGSFAVLDALKEASCRWYMQNYGVGAVNASWRAAAGVNTKKRHFSGVRSRHSMALDPDAAPKDIEKQIPRYCKSGAAGAGGVKYSDMERLHVRLRERNTVDGRELQFLLRKFFRVHISIAAATHLLKLLSVMNGMLLLESRAPEVFQFILNRFVHPNLVVHPAGASSSSPSSAEQNNSENNQQQQQQQQQQSPQAIACIRAESPFSVAFSSPAAPPSGEAKIPFSAAFKAPVAAATADSQQLPSGTKIFGVQEPDSTICLYASEMKSSSSSSNSNIGGAKSADESSPVAAGSEICAGVFWKGKCLK